MLVVVALGFGRAVTHWWYDRGAKPAVGPSAALGGKPVGQTMAFGDQAWSIRRHEFSGPRGQLAAALQSECRTVIGNAVPRGESPDAAELELLQRLGGQRPVAEQQGQWRLYEWGQDHPIVIGTRAVGRTGHDTGNNPAPGARTSLDETVYRVVIWGLAIPVAPDAWTLYLFQAGGTTQEPGQPDAEIPLPPGGHRLVSIRAAAGDAITAFSADEGNAVREFYDRWFAEHGWVAAAGWQPIAAGWHVRFERRSTGPALAVDLRLGMDSPGRWIGVLMESEFERGKP